MIRIVIENLFIFLIPTLSYLTWIAFRRNDWPGLGRVLRDAPLVQLFVSGAVLMIGTLVLFSTREYNSPQEQYIPSVFKDGRIQPGTPPSPPPPAQPERK